MQKHVDEVRLLYSASQTSAVQPLENTTWSHEEQVEALTQSQPQNTTSSIELPIAQEVFLKEPETEALDAENSEIPQELVNPELRAVTAELVSNVWVEHVELRQSLADDGKNILKYHHMPTIGRLPSGALMVRPQLFMVAWRNASSGVNVPYVTSSVSPCRLYGKRGRKRRGTMISTCVRR